MGLMATILLICESMFVVQHRAGDQVKKDIARLNIVRQILLRLEPLVQNAGFSGIQSIPSRAITVHHALAHGWSPALPIELHGKVAKGSDVLILEAANPSSEYPASGWYAIDDGFHAEIYRQSEGASITFKHEYRAHKVISPWEITAFYLQHTEDGLGLMQKSISPSKDALNLLSHLEGFRCEFDGGLLTVQVKYQHEWMTIWVGN
jgi:hypothetical protein